MPKLSKPSIAEDVVFSLPPSFFADFNKVFGPKPEPEVKTEATSKETDKNNS